MEQQGAGGGGGFMLFGTFISKENRKPKRSVVILPPPQFQPLPSRCRQFLAEKGAAEDPTLVFARTLHPTDVSKGHNRLSMPRYQVKASFLLGEEVQHIRQKDECGKPNKMKVMVVDPALKVLTMNLTLWNAKNENGCWWYALNNNWMDVVSRNELVVRDAIQVWSFRIDGKLWFLIHKLDADHHGDIDNNVIIDLNADPNVPTADDDDDDDDATQGDEDKDYQGFDVKRRRLHQ